MRDAMSLRLYKKALANQVAVAIGSGCSPELLSPVVLSEKMIKHFNLDITIDTVADCYKKWNVIVKAAVEASSIQELQRFLIDLIGAHQATNAQQFIASLPFANYIDCTYDRFIGGMLKAKGKVPMEYDWDHLLMGSWKERNASSPNVFYMLPSVDKPAAFTGLQEPISLWPSPCIQIMNIRDMLHEKDLILFGFCQEEAESFLHLDQLFDACNKIVIPSCGIQADNYWLNKGACALPYSCDQLLPNFIPSNGKSYTFWDMLVPRTSLLDINKEKKYDGFISYFSGERDFVRRIHSDLNLRELHIWLDENEIGVGDSITDKIQQGLSNSYTILVVLSQESVKRQWLKEELRAAYAKRLAGELKILPILHEECDIPELLADYKYADFRDEKRYAEQLNLLEKAIKKAVRISREKEFE